MPATRHFLNKVMARGSRSRPAFDEQSIYAYPEHLRASLMDMPAKPGVYIFHAGQSELPLYIGKSINLRTRLLSHLRNADEARLLKQATHISHIRTAGEIGALLLEAQLIKQQQPLFNQKLRRNRQLYAWSLDGYAPVLVSSKEMDFAATIDLYGLYASRTAALQALRNLADQHNLCHGQLGLEKLPENRPCFRHMLKKCYGACCGLESESAHAQRLQSALDAIRISTWPYPGPIGLQESCDDMQQIHVVNNWCYLGSAEDIPAARKLAKVAAGFDMDGYKILCRPILAEQLPILAL